MIPILGLIEAGGWTKLKGTDRRQRRQQRLHPHVDHPRPLQSDNPMGVHWTGIVFGLGFVVAFGYWTTDFLVVQRVLSANNLRAAKMAPVIGAAFKMAVPFIVIVPGLLALAVLKNPDGSMMHLVASNIAKGNPNLHSYDEVLPLMLIRYCGPGLLGLGITALIAGFMSGMAGNVSAFSTVWTYDIYGAFMNKKASDKHYVAMGRASTVVGMLISIMTAYLVMNANSIMDYVQALFSFFIAPLFGTVILGMMWKRATHAGGFWGLLAGTASSISMFIWVQLQPTALRFIAMSPDARPHGRKPLSRPLELDHLRRRHHRRQPGHQACAGRRTGQPCLRRHADPRRRLQGPLPEADLLGRCRHRRLLHPEPDLLLNEATAANHAKMRHYV